MALEITPTRSRHGRAPSAQSIFSPARNLRTWDAPVTLLRVDTVLPFFVVEAAVKCNPLPNQAGLAGRGTRKS
jgi:hypothetical protein